MNEIVVYVALIIVWIVYFLYNIKKVNISWLFSILFLLIYGYGYVSYQIDMEDIEQEHIKTLTVLLTCFVIFFNIGNKLFFLHKNNDNLNYMTWMEQEEKPVYFQKKSMYVVSLIAVAVILMGLFFYNGINALKTVFTSPLISPEDFNELREDAGVEGWIAPIYAYMITAIGRFFAFLGLAYAIKTKNRIALVFFGFYNLIILVGLLGNLSKSAAFIFLFQLIFLFTLIKNYILNFKKILIFFGSFLVLLISIYIFTTGVEDSSAALDLIKYRIFSEPNRVLSLYTEYYPKYYPHTSGMNIRLIHGLFGHGEYISSDVKLANFKGTVNAFFIGDAWVDFSYIGVIIESLFLGIYLAFLDSYIFKQKNLVTQVVFACILLGVLSLPSLPMLPCMITFGLLSVVLLSKFIRLKIVFK